MNRNDVLVFALVAFMVGAVALAVTARYPGANLGSVADWFAAIGTIFAACTALYIAHHEAQRAREVLLEQRADLAARDLAAAAALRQERLRSDAITVLATNGALSDGLASYAAAIRSVEGQEPDKRSLYARVFLDSARVTGPSAELAAITPSTAFLAETTAYLSAAKSGWGACISRLTLLAQPGLTDERVAMLIGVNDIRDRLKSGYELHWRLCADCLAEPIPDQVAKEIEVMLKSST